MRLLLAALAGSAAAACTVTRVALPLPADFVIEATGASDGAETRHAWIGLEVDLNETEDLNSLDVRPGVRVTRVEPDGPAARAGLQVGDVLLEWDAAPVNDPGRLAAMLANVHEARPVAIQAERRTRVFAAQVMPEIRTTEAGQTLAYVERALLRVAVRDAAASAADPQGRWPEVVGFGPESPLQSAGARAGDRITAFQGRDPGSAAAFVRRIGLELQPGAGAEFTLLAPDGTLREVRCAAWSPGVALTALGLWPLFCWEREADGSRGVFWLGDLLLLQVFRVDRVGGERQYSLLGLLHWSTGEAYLQEEAVATLPLSGAASAP